MSEYNFYLVPVDEPSAGRRGIGDRILNYLEQQGVLEGFYDEELGWYAAGPKSADLFTDVSAKGPAFEYAILYDRQEAHFVPDSQTAGFGARCSGCQADLDEEVYELLEEQGEGEEVIDVAGRKLNCPKCRLPNPLVTLKAEIDTAVTRFYVNFCAVDSFNLNPEILDELQKIVGTKFRLVGERL